jgi:hypothetical protein
MGLISVKPKAKRSNMKHSRPIASEEKGLAEARIPATRQG